MNIAVQEASEPFKQLVDAIGHLNRTEVDEARMILNGLRGPEAQ